MSIATQNQRAAAATAQPGSEQDIRLGMLNTLLTTPHRDLPSIYPVHQQMLQQDPLFYVRLAAWYSDTGEIRDHKEMFTVCLCLSDFPGHRDAGLAMLRELPPYQVGRVVDFIHGKRIRKVTVTETGTGKNKKKNSTVSFENFGLGKNIPNSMQTEIKRYLQERETDHDWFDSTVLASRNTLQRLYALNHLKPSERAQKILFQQMPPDDSKLASVKSLRKAATPAEQARIIVENKVPYRIASTVVSQMTPTVLLALIEVMSDQELINSLGSLKKRGALDNPDLKELVNKRLDKAKTGKRVAAMKTSTARDAGAANLGDEINAKLNDIGDTQLKARGRIKRSTAIIIDKSGSMNIAIEIGKRLGSMISTVMDAPLFVYAADTMAYPIKAKDANLSSWEQAFMGIRATGGTSCGIGIAALLRNKERVEQIVMVTDEGENQSPPFLTTLQT
jgi:hypothetical protein